MTPITTSNEQYCDYCHSHGFKAALFRIVDSYPHGEAFEWSDECDGCRANKQHCNTDIDDACEQEDGDCEACRFCNCDTCDYAPYQPQNSLNITIAVSGGKLMFEDKNLAATPGEGKQYAKINYCPTCGQALDWEVSE